MHMTKEQYLELLEKQFRIVVDNKVLSATPHLRMLWNQHKPAWLSGQAKLWEASGKTSLADFYAWVNNLGMASGSLMLQELLDAEDIIEFDCALRAGVWQLAGVDKTMTEEEQDATNLFAQTFTKAVDQVLAAKRKMLESQQ